MNFYQCPRNSNAPEPWRGVYRNPEAELDGWPSLLDMVEDADGTHENLRFLAKKDGKTKTVFCVACARDGIKHSLELETQSVWPYDRKNKDAIWTPRECRKKNEIMIWSYEKPTKEYPISVYVPWGTDDYIKSLAFATSGELKARGLWPPVLAGMEDAVPVTRTIRHSGCIPENRAVQNDDPEVVPSWTSLNNSRDIPSTSKRPMKYETPSGEATKTNKRPKHQQSSEPLDSHDAAVAFLSAASELSRSNSGSPEPTTDSVAPKAQSKKHPNSKAYNSETDLPLISPEELSSYIFRPNYNATDSVAPKPQSKRQLDLQSYRFETSLSPIPPEDLNSDKPQTNYNARCETVGPDDGHILQGDELNHHDPTHLPTPSDLYSCSPRVEAVRPSNDEGSCAEGSSCEVAATEDGTIPGITPRPLDGNEWTRGQSARSSDSSAGETSIEDHRSSEPATNLQDIKSESPTLSAESGPSKNSLTNQNTRLQPQDNVATEFRRLQLQRKILLGKEGLDESVPRNKHRLERRLSVLQIENRLDELSVVAASEDKITTDVRRLQRERNMLLIEEELDDSAPRDRRRREREVKILEIVYELDLLGVVVDS